MSISDRITKLVKMESDVGLVRGIQTQEIKEEFMSKYSVAGDVLMENGINKIHMVTGTQGAYSDTMWSTIACFLEENVARKPFHMRR